LDLLKDLQKSLESYPINLYISHGINGFLFNMLSKATEIASSILAGSIDIELVSAKSQRYAKP